MNRRFSSQRSLNSWLFGAWVAAAACSAACTTGLARAPTADSAAALDVEAPALRSEAELKSKPLAFAPGFFSAEQAGRGRASYRQWCDECHASSEFRGDEFEWKWRRQTAWDLYREISSNMPESQPGSLPEETYTDIVAYLLSLNEYQVGGQDLLGIREELAEIPLGAGVEKVRPFPAGRSPEL